MRNSRWTTKPITKNGRIVGTKPVVPGDIDILKALSRFPLLTIDDICGQTGRSYPAIAARVNKLKREPLKLIEVHKTQREQPAMWQWSPQVLHLTRHGTALLNEIGIEPKAVKPSIHFIHQLTLSQTEASFAVGAKRADLQLVTFDEIVADPRCNRKQPSFPVKFSFRGEEKSYGLTPDAAPFGLRYHDGSYRFLVVETDCGSEPLSSSNRDRQAIELKFAAYIAALSSRAYQLFGIPHLTVVFTTTTNVRMENMMSLLATMTTDYTPFFCFHTFPTLLSGKQPTDKSWAVTRPWLRVRIKPLNLGGV